MTKFVVIIKVDGGEKFLNMSGRKSCWRANIQEATRFSERDANDQKEWFSDLNCSPRATYETREITGGF